MDSSGTPLPAAAPGAAGEEIPPRRRVQALLGYALETRLLHGRARSLRIRPLPSPWDIWWVCSRAGLGAAELAVDPAAQAGGSCPACRELVARLVAPSEPRFPDLLTAEVCGHLRAWAVRLRTPAEPFAWPTSRLCVAVIKPGAPGERIRDLLDVPYQVLAADRRRLTPADTRRLYPDAYGAEWIAERDAYLTGTPVEVLVLATRPETTASPLYVKATIRAQLPEAGLLRNYLHMPDMTGETYADLDHLAGTDLLRELYGRYERDRAAERLACYRAVLAGR
jgi:hypothetical protein